MFQSSINKDPWPTKILSCRFPCYISLVLMSHQLFILFTVPPWEPQHRENISLAFMDSYLVSGVRMRSYPGTQFFTICEGKLSV